MLLDRASAAVLTESTDGTASPIGLRLRGRREGPEAEFVDHFVAQPPVSLRNGEIATVFREPELESGAPDVVVVVWRPGVASKWPEARAELTPADLRVAHLLAGVCRATDAELGRLSHRAPGRSLERLEAAGIARRLGPHWVMRPLSRIFAVREIVSFEAKISDCREALLQAAANAWFASRSYALFPRRVRSASVIGLARTARVGIWTGAPARRLVGSAYRPQPVSYASWLFNEWAWRAARLATR